MSLAFDYCTPGNDNIVPGTFLMDVLTGLSGRPKTLPAKYFYDATGSRLFDRITELDEYYPTRTEIALLERHADHLADSVGPDAVVVEFGAGSLTKARILLDELDAPHAYVPIDVSGPHLMSAAAELRHRYPALRIEPVIADFTTPIQLPDMGGAKMLGFFPGSTIGNFDPDEARRFLGRVATTLPQGALFLVGVDTKKDRAVLERAYDDRLGVTAGFNLNLLERINRELGGDFDLARFAHRAFYNDRLGRIEMHLESLCDQTVRIAGRSFRFRAGETIHTENSYKYKPSEFTALASNAGWRARELWMDGDGLFSLHLLEDEISD